MDAEQIKRILIVRTDRVGDVILTTPAIKALRARFPQARLTILVTPVTCPLVQGNPFLDEVILDDRKGVHKGFAGFLKLVGALRRRRFDLAVVFHTKRRTNLLCFLAGVKYRLGYRNNKFGFFLNCPVEDQRAEGHQHEAQYCLDLLQPLGIQSTDLETYVPVEPQAEEWLRELFAGAEIKAPVAAVHAGASDPSKQWPAECFAEVVKHLADVHHCRIVMIGTEDQKGVVSAIQKKAGVSLLDMTGRTSVAQLTVLLRGCDFLLSNDSGPVHLADALQTPVVSIFTRNQPGINPERWGPLSARSRWVAPLPGKCFFPEGRISDRIELKIVGPEEVIAAVDEVFKLC